MYLEHVPLSGKRWISLRGILKRLKTGEFECRVHPTERLCVFNRILYCPKCFEPVRYRFGRKFYTQLERVHPEPNHMCLMSRTRAARMQPEESDE